MRVCEWDDCLGEWEMTAAFDRCLAESGISWAINSKDDSILNLLSTIEFLLPVSHVSGSMQTIRQSTDLWDLHVKGTLLLAFLLSNSEIRWAIGALTLSEVPSVSHTTPRRPTKDGIVGEESTWYWPYSRPRMRKHSMRTGVDSCKMPRGVESNQRLVWSFYLSVHLALLFLKFVQIALCWTENMKRLNYIVI